MRVLFPVKHPTTEEPIIVEYGETGFFPVSIEKYADACDSWVWDDDVLESAQLASIFGWHTPAATKAGRAAEKFIETNSHGESS